MVVLPSPPPFKVVRLAASEPFSPTLSTPNQNMLGDHSREVERNIPNVQACFQLTAGIYHIIIIIIIIIIYSSPKGACLQLELNKTIINKN